MVIDKITDTIFIGSRYDLTTVEEIRSKKINSILSLDERNEEYRDLLDPIVKGYWRLAPIKDLALGDIGNARPQIASVLEAVQELETLQKRGRSTLVCCVGGTGASPLVVALYLFFAKKIEPESAIQLLKNTRR